MGKTEQSRKSVVRGALLAIVGLIAAGCVPYWENGGTITVNGNNLSWPAAQEDDPGEEIAYYQIWIDGVRAGLTTVPNCTLSGLAGGTSYLIRVRAWDTAGEYSGTITGQYSFWGVLSETVTPSGSDPEMVPFCSGGPDADGDRLPDIVETNTGSYSSLASTGTDPNNPDTDGDGIEDGDETLGTTAGLNLPGMGTSPVHEDLLLEYDWFNDTNDCGWHSHKPTVAAINAFTAPFTNAPRSNPDGVNGINVINDYGQGGLFTGGNQIADADGVLIGGVGGAEYLTKKAANFASNRNGYFHYVMLPHRYNTTSGSSGQAEIYGDDLIVSLQCFNSTSNVSKTIAHELGHNLGLRHGGFENQNYKPNYNSVMNYRFQFPGVDTTCDALGDGGVDYSIGDRISIDENNINENFGTCGNVPIDWNNNNVLQNGLVLDLNGQGGLTTINDHNDWANIYFLGIGDSDGARLAAPELIEEQPIPVEYQNNDE